MSRRLLTLGLVSLLGAGVAGDCGEEQVQQDLLSLTTPSVGYIENVQIKFDEIEFSEEDFGEHINYIVFDEVPVDERTRRFNEVAREMSIYPNGLVGQNLENIFVVDRLRYKGGDWAGTRTDEDVYITTADIPRAVHAEFSSVLYLNNRDRFPFLEWINANPSGFWYSSSSTAEDISGLGQDWLQNDFLLGEGFLSSYSKVGPDLENDFNGIYKALIVDTPRLLEIESWSPRIKRKVDLTLRFLNNVSGTKFDREYFLDKWNEMSSLR